MVPPPKTPFLFYRSAAGKEPVRDWLKSLRREDRLEIGQDFQRVQYRWPVGMPLCRAMGDRLWEVRTNLPSGTIARVLICFHGGALIALHGFIKKTQKTPDDELKIARRRKKGNRRWPISTSARASTTSCAKKACSKSFRPGRSKR